MKMILSSTLAMFVVLSSAGADEFKSLRCVSEQYTALDEDLVVTLTRTARGYSLVWWAGAQGDSEGKATVSEGVGETIYSRKEVELAVSENDEIATFTFFDEELEHRTSEKVECERR